MEKSVSEEIPKVPIKTEAFNDDIKEFAETAMNELLGWYGYGNNNHRDARACRSHSGSNSSGPESPKFNEGCGWCGKPVDESTGLSSAAAVFCSELCFSQSRRANFKKNRTCDWCRHVRHTVSYVDSQDGSTQLQFCSDKCLNQYKMHIFWRETRAHLEIHPHIHGEETSGTLITPDLWLNKCKSPEVQGSSPSSSPKLSENPQQTSPLPLITVAHPSKLMSIPLQEAEVKRQRSRVHRKNKKKNIPLPNCTNTNRILTSEMPQDLRIRHTPTDFESLNSRAKLDEKSKVNECTSAETESRLGQSHSINSSENVSSRKLLDSLVPPPTILVPYPLILPLPIPIPIPIPLPILNGCLNKNTPDVNEKKFRDIFSQTEDEVSSQNASEDIVENNEKFVTARPQRKRKRVVEKKSKFVLKNKKILSS